jgi:hypothetical protein
MENLILKKDGIIQTKIWKYDKNKNKGEYENYIVNPAGLYSDTYLFSLLNKTICLEDNYTVRDYFKLILNYPIFQKLDPYFKSFIEEYNSCPESNCINSDNTLDYIQFKKIIDINNFDLEKNQIEECDIFIDICGISESEEISYSIDFVPLKDYLDLPIKLANGVISTSIYNTKKEKKKRYKNKSKSVQLCYTLFDFITTFIYEISFHGTSKERDLKGEELNTDDLDKKELELK